MMGHIQLFGRASWLGLLALFLGGIGLIALLGACCTPGAAAAPAPPRVSLTVESGIIYVSTGYGTGPGAVAGQTTTFGASDGARVAGGVSAGFLGASSGMVYVTQPKLFQALRASDHALRWQYPVSTVDALAVSDESVYLADYSTIGAEVVALRASDGATLWRYKLATGIVTRLAAGVGIVSFVAGGALVTVRASDGSLLWQQDTRSLSVTSLTVQAGTVYLDAFTSEDTSGQVEALQASDGSLLWQHKSDQGQQRLLAVQNGVAYLGNDAALLAVRASDGSLLWQQPINGAVNAAVTAGSSAVYLALMGELRAFRASDGALLWQQPIQTSIDGYTYALAQTVDTLYLAVGGLRQGSGCVVTTSGFVLQAERISDGKLLWSAQG
ncbi:MAG TPA: PQQ-binding-like beta-propeller repeat protein [Ktedonobacterales bacterium]|nr:PQQ-binding-like beta-propeller repeat protein [Ktedonobacterales bacterium]